jgi:hypothetical protein
LSCSNYATKSKTELLYFGVNKINYDTIYSFPYTKSNFPLLLQTRQSSGTGFYRSSHPVSDSFYIVLRSKKDTALLSFLKSEKVKLGTSVSSCGYMDLSKLGFSFLDSSIVKLDSIRFAKHKWIPINGTMYLTINKIGETDLKVISYDTTFFVHFNIDSMKLTITNPGYYKRWEEKAFFWFTWPEKKK